MRTIARGLILSSDYLDPKLLLDFLGMVEDFGYDTVVFPEMWGHDAFTIIAQAMHVTSKIKFATGIVNIYSRSPATLAQTAASLSELSDGRFILGLGASGPKVIEGFHGIPYGKPLQRTREVVSVIRSLLAGERLNHSGEYFNVSDFKLMFTPEYPVPIFLAALGPKNLTLAGQIADGWYPIWASRQQFKEFSKPVLDGLRDSGRERSDFTIAPFLITCASSDPSLTTKLARRHIAYYVGKMGTFYYELAKRFGYTAEADQIRKLYPQDREKAATIISDSMLDDIAVTGGVEEARAKMAAWDDAVDLPLVFLPYKTPPEVAFETVEALAPK